MGVAERESGHVLSLGGRGGALGAAAGRVAQDVGFHDVGLKSPLEAAGGRGAEMELEEVEDLEDLFEEFTGMTRGASSTAQPQQGKKEDVAGAQGSVGGDGGGRQARLREDADKDDDDDVESFFAEHQIGARSASASSSRKPPTSPAPQFSGNAGLASRAAVQQPGSAALVPYVDDEDDDDVSQFLSEHGIVASRASSKTMVFGRSVPVSEDGTDLLGRATSVSKTAATSIGKSTHLTNLEDLDFDADDILDLLEPAKPPQKIGDLPRPKTSFGRR